MSKTTIYFKAVRLATKELIKEAHSFLSREFIAKVIYGYVCIEVAIKVFHQRDPNVLWYILALLAIQKMRSSYTFNLYFDGKKD